MTVRRTRKTHEEMRAHILLSAAKSFKAHGYNDATLRSIAQQADVNIGSLMNLFNSKEDILCEIIAFVIEKQHEITLQAVQGMTEDKYLILAAEATLQLYIVESNENLREVYSAAYSMPKSSSMIQHRKTGMYEEIFKDHLPHLETKDFYKLEIASGGIMRGFMTIPCDMWFTMDQKVESFLESAFLIYRVPDEKINEAIEFVKKFDFTVMAEITVKAILEHMESSLVSSGRGQQ